MKAGMEQNGTNRGVRQVKKSFETGCALFPIEFYTHARSHLLDHSI